ncbi:hypothetical protein N7465_011885 [Penicillium sp. CMV-2018d]|nr:hypothetical protein N7465_011885 [Penicillium sp. CMV-2018d]
MTIQLDHKQDADYERLELQTQLHLSRIWRNNARREILREARIIRRRAIRIQLEYATNGQPPRAQMLLEALIRNMQILWAEEESAHEIEAEVWRDIR